jgi:hypothetical protein
VRIIAQGQFDVNEENVWPASYGHREQDVGISPLALFRSHGHSAGSKPLAWRH